MSDQKAKPEVKDELLTAYAAATAEDSFVPSPRVKSAVLMYARTLADHRNAFPGSVAHENPEEETELASVPVDNKNLDPRPLPIKPLNGEDDSEDEPNLPRDLPPVPPSSAWLSLGKWVVAASAGGLALGMGYSWFNASRMPRTAPEPMIAQAPEVAPKVAAEPSTVIAAAPAASPATTTADMSNVAKTAPLAESNTAKDSRAKETAEAAIAAAPQARPAPPKLPVPPAKPQNKQELKSNETKLAKARNETSNPPVAVADGSPVNAPQISTQPLRSAPPESIAMAPAAPTAAAPPPPAAAAPAAVGEAATSAKAARAYSGQAASQASQSANTADARISAALGRPEHEAEPAKWMIYINDLKSRGRTREADIELVRLRERYPQFNTRPITRFIDRPTSKPSDDPNDASAPTYTPATPASSPR